MTTYAADTSVSVEKSRAEIESILARYGASRFGYMTDDRQAIIVFEANGKAVKFTLSFPDPKDEKFTKRWRVTGARRYYLGPASAEQAHKAWEQVCRARWRSLGLAVKAKLNSVAEGITSFEIEFLAHFVVPGGKTIGQHIIPQLDDMAKSGKMPRLQLTDGHTDIS